MTAPTKEALRQAALNALSQYPAVALAVQAGDPRVLAQIGAQVEMLSLMVDHTEVSRFEAFTKSRDSTILADASLKGILPLARACRVKVSLQNKGGAAFQVVAGRRFLDSKGRLYQADAAVTIPSGQTALVAMTQKDVRSVSHTVQIAQPFYEIQVPLSDSVHLASLSVWKGSAELAYSPDYFNITAGQLAYTVETDELRRLWVRMGDSSRVGYSVSAGDVFEMRITECEGAVTDLTAGETFTLQYILTPADGQVSATLSTVDDSGANPPTMADLRVMARYPAIYDHNAVYLGEFDALLRRYLSPRFLSVWNEQIEESVRGASVNNINTLFVSGLINGMANAAFEARVRELIARADDSYKVRFVATDIEPVPVSIVASVSVVHDAASVESQIRAAVLAAFGDGAPDVSQGMRNPIRVQAITRILKAQVPALQDDAADFRVTVTLPATVLPEQFLHVSAASLSVTVQRANFGNALWSY